MTEQTGAEDTSSCVFRSSASGPWNQTCVYSPVCELLGKRLTYRRMRQGPDKRSWHLFEHLPGDPKSWIKHWQGIDSRQATNRGDQFPTCSLQWIHECFKRMQIKVSPHKSMLSKDKNNAVTKKRKLSENCCFWFFYMKKQKAKQNDYNGRSEISSVFSFRWKSHTHSITNIHTHLALHSPFRVQVYIKHSCSVL